MYSGQFNGTALAKQAQRRISLLQQQETWEIQMPISLVRFSFRQILTNRITGTR
jgi:hypothetical protein